MIQQQHQQQHQPINEAYQDIEEVSELKTHPVAESLMRLTYNIKFITLGIAFFFDCIRKPNELTKFTHQHHNSVTRKYYYLTAWFVFIILFIYLTSYLIRFVLVNLIRDSSLYATIFKSTFMTQLIYAAIGFIAINQLLGGFVVMSHLDTISSIEALQVFVTKKEQIEITNSECKKTILISTIQTIGFTVVIYNMINDKSSPISTSLYLISFALIFFLFNMSQLSSAIAVSCLGSVLGRHIENFSQAYIDTMYDQLAKYVNQDNDYNDEVKPNDELNAAADNLENLLNLTEANVGDNHKNDDDDGDEDSSNSDSSSNTDQSNKKKTNRKVPAKKKASKKNKKTGAFLMKLRGSSVSIIVKVLVKFGRLLVATFRRLSVRRYPKSADMEVTKQSTALAGKMTESMKIANSALIRKRLRKLQIVMTDMRDAIHEINSLTTSLMSAIFLSILFVILTTTMSIQAQDYSSLAIATPPILFGLALGMFIINTCVMCDSLVSQSKSMMNKLFDFIIINHRDTDTKAIDPRNDNAIITDTSKYTTTDSSISTRRYIDEALSETWSQFQYVRKLSNSITFTLLGIMPVTKRVVFVLLAYVLSATFISIEMKSIVDT